MKIKGKKGILKAGYGNKIFLFCLILEQTLKYKNIIKMNLDLMEFIYSRDNLPRKIKDGAYAINLDEYGDVGIHWIVCIIQILKLFILKVLELNKIYSTDIKT